MSPFNLDFSSSLAVSKYSFLLLDVDVHGHLVVLLNPSPLYLSFYLFFFFTCFALI